MNWYKQAKDEEYRGNHTPAVPEEGASLDNLSAIYDDDIYSVNGARYYGDRVPYDQESIRIINYAKGRPNAQVTVYRAVPDFDKDLNKKIKEYTDIISYYHKFNFFPVGNGVMYEIQDKHPIDSYNSYEEQQKAILDAVWSTIEGLKRQKSPKVSINAGDWVTLSKQYAIEHGKGNLNNSYRVVQKTVRAKDLYTEGNSIHEWGYHPS